MLLVPLTEVITVIFFDSAVDRSSRAYSRPKINFSEIWEIICFVWSLTEAYYTRLNTIFFVFTSGMMIRLEHKID